MHFKMRNRFIRQTSLDYDMKYSDVAHIHFIWADKGLFYVKLEEFIKERKN